MQSPFDDFAYLVNHVLLGEEPTIEDFILMVGTLVAFVAFILWCCFPIQPRESSSVRQVSCKTAQQMHSSTASSSPSQHSNYGKNCSATEAYNYGFKNGHTYHCCT